MNDEIKEILDFKENADYKRLSCDEIKVLRDYIHNLWRNNWGNEVKATNQKIKIKELEKRIVKLKDYKSRIEKAVEYIKRFDLIIGYYDYNDEGYDEIGENNNLQEELLDILNGKE